MILIFSFFKDLQLLNISSKLKLLILLVLKEDKSYDFKEEQKLNIELILLTLLVLNEDKSIDFKEEQS